MKTLIRILAFLLLCPLAADAQGLIMGGQLEVGGRQSADVALGAAAYCNPVPNGATNVNSISVNAIAAGTNRTLIAVAHWNVWDALISSVVTETQPFTLVGTAMSENLVKVSIWQLVAPILGTQTVTARFDREVGGVSLCVLNYANVNQVTPTRNFASSSGGAGPVHVSTTSAAGDAVLTVFVSANNFVLSSTDTSVIREVNLAGIVARIGTRPAAAIVEMDYQLSGVNAWNAAMIDIVKSP